MSATSDPTCRNCRASMERGYRPDRGHGNAQHVEEWARGEPQKAQWLFITYIKGVGKKDLLPITTWRCPRCGLLESYAR